MVQLVQLAAAQVAGVGLSRCVAGMGMRSGPNSAPLHERCAVELTCV